MPKRKHKHKSRLRKDDFKVYTGQPKSTVLQTKETIPNAHGEAMQQKAGQSAKRIVRGAGSVLVWPFLGIGRLLQKTGRGIKRLFGKDTDQTPLPYYKPAISVHAPEIRGKNKETLPVMGTAGVVLPKEEQAKPAREKSKKPGRSIVQQDDREIEKNFRKKQAQRQNRQTEKPPKQRQEKIRPIKTDKPKKQKKEKSPRKKGQKAGWGKRLSIAAVVLLLCGGLGWGGWYYFEGRYVYLTVDDDGTEISIRSATPNVEQMLAEAGIVLAPDDEIDTPLETALADEMSIHIIRAKTITIDTGDGNQTQALLAQGTVQQALDKAGVTLGADDEIDTPLDTAIEADMEVKITRAKQINIKAKAGNKTVMLASGTVKDALDKSGLTYDTEDEISPSLDTAISEGMTITLVRLTVKYETHTEKIAYETVEKKSNRVERGTKEVSQKGVTGIRTIKEKVVYKDGVEVKRVEVSNEVTKQKVDKVVLIGTGPPMNPAVKGLPETPTSSMIVRKVTVDQVTAYTHTGHRTATGKWPKVGMCAVNPRIFPYGTMFYVPGYGYAVAEDTGANNSSLVSIDLFMDTKEDCLRWGRKRNVTVTIVRR